MLARGGELPSLPSKEEGGAEGREEGEEGVASSTTVTSPPMSLGDGERDLGQGGSGEPPVLEPSGEGRSMEGEGEGEAERREEGRAPEVSAGASAPGQAAVEPPILQAWGEVKKTQTL